MATILPTSARRFSVAGKNPPPDEYLPESDGKPMAETDVHRDLMMALLHALEEFFREDPMTYVTGNIFVYYLDENGVRQPAVSPDIFVVRGVAKKERRIYKIEEEGRAPEVVIELTSTSTKVEDLVTKHYIYAGLGVQEYFLFDPYREALNSLHGFRLQGGEYVPLKGASLFSEVLGLELRVEERHLRLYDPRSRELLLTPKEAEAARRAAEKKAAAETKRAAAEAQRAVTETKRAAAEANRAAAAEAQVRQETAARQAAESELARLREEIARLRETKS